MLSTSGALPVLLGLGAAFLFGLSSVTTKRGLAYLPAQTGALISIGTATLIYLLLSPLWMHAGDWFGAGFWVFVLNGLIHPMLSMYLAFEATARTGPTVAATFAATAPLFAAITAILFLGESINAIIAIGTVGIVIGIMVLSWLPQGFSTLMRAALLFATGAAIIRGLNHTVGKWGLELLPNVFMAGFVSFSVSFIGSLVMYRLRYGTLPQQLPRWGLGYFVLTGTILSGAILCMYGALATGDVVVVSPLVNAYPLFTLIAAFAVGQERFTRRTVVGVLLVVGGVALVSAASAR